jgi:hypothetical protein
VLAQLPGGVAEWHHDVVEGARAGEQVEALEDEAELLVADLATWRAPL